MSAIDLLEKAINELIVQENASKTRESVPAAGWSSDKEGEGREEKGSGESEDTSSDSSDPEESAGDRRKGRHGGRDNSRGRGHSGPRGGQGSRRDTGHSNRFVHATQRAKTAQRRENQGTN
ncbi:TPA_asm: X protein [Bombay duck fish bornavirus]|uniref:X protein n=1 Tax=Bombay duck fish bornavirus TaxID=3067899 RepID=A0AA48P918_9MONO|nr:TPA_asm: X protein [Bombay duck fish bornavirus]